MHLLSMQQTGGVFDLCLLACLRGGALKQWVIQIDATLFKFRNLLLTLIVANKVHLHVHQSLTDTFTSPYIEKKLFITFIHNTAQFLNTHTTHSPVCLQLNPNDCHVSLPFPFSSHFRLAYWRWIISRLKITVTFRVWLLLYLSVMTGL